MNSAYCHIYFVAALSAAIASILQPTSASARSKTKLEIPPFRQTVKGLQLTLVIYSRGGADCTAYNSNKRPLKAKFDFSPIEPNEPANHDLVKIDAHQTYQVYRWTGLVPNAVCKISYVELPGHKK